MAQSKLRFGLTRESCCTLVLTFLLLVGCSLNPEISESLPNTSPTSQPLSQLRTSPEPQSKIVSLSGSGQAKILKGGQHVAVTANPHASQAALAVLEKGGLAIDAAIAAQMVLGLVEPQSSGIGGGGFLLYWDAKKQQLFSYDGRETAPAAADERLFIDGEGKPLSLLKAIIGGRSVGVPGLLAMLELAHQQHGVTDWEVLFEDAIALSRQGFPVSERLHTLISKVPALTVRPEISAYLFEEENPLPVGHVLRNPAYADTLRAIARSGAAAFYQGEIASAIQRAVALDANAGALSLDDMSSYSAKSRKPVCKVVFDHRLCGMGPPSSGGTTVLAILSTMESLQQKHSLSSDQSIGHDLATTHAFIEASRLAFADRYTYIADPDFVEVPISGLLDDTYLLDRASLVNTDSRNNDISAGRPPGVSPQAFVTADSLELPSTTHLSIVDRFGNIASMTTSIETAFGSRLMAAGFFLNNQLTDFSFVPENEGGQRVANRVQDGKRPTSSMSPMIVFDKNNQPVMALGSPGGRSIIPYVARVLYETLALNRPLTDVVEEKHVVDTGKLRLEEGIDAELIVRLKALGHTPEIRPQTSGIHALQKTAAGWLGVADPRREGTVSAR